MSRWLVALAAFWIFQAWTLGVSDDEAYYWVLAQNPSLGYAYHPPMVAWAIAALDWIPVIPRELKLRLPSILFSLFYWWIGVRWVHQIKCKQGGTSPSHSDIAWLLIPGLIGAGWMAVPDLPLLTGWALCFAGISSPRARWSAPALLAGSAMGVLSKFSAVLYIASAAACLWFEAPREKKPRLMAALVMGTILGVLPTLYWNHLNDWAALRYQFVERHRSGGKWDTLRYLKFWATQLILAGPALLASLALVFRKWERSRLFIMAWVIPAALIFWIQPAFSDFKPHWALIAWWPLGLLVATLRDRPRWLDQLQWGWSLSIILAFSILTQVPVQGALTRWWTGLEPDPRMDVTNDMVGWRNLPAFINEKLGQEASQLPVTASRYQTASQAAFSLMGSGQSSRLVSLVPKSLAEGAEWPSLADAGVVEREIPGREWPTLTRPVLYVHDLRYHTAPAFPGADCKKLGVLETRRWDLPAREVHLWRCDPKK